MDFGLRYPEGIRFMNRPFVNISINFLAALLLLSVILVPLFFVNNFAKVAGVKTESPYLLIPQVDKFPSAIFEQAERTYTVKIKKQSPKQVYLSILIINNPTPITKKYKLINYSEENSAFFGEEISSMEKTVILPSGTSSPISISTTKNEEDAIVTFEIESE